MKQRGFAIPSLLEVIGVLVAAAGLVWALHALVGGVTDYIAARDAKIDKGGYDRAKAEDALADNKALVELQGQLLAAQTKAAEDQVLHNRTVAALAAKLKEAKDGAQQAGVALLHDLDSGALILRDDVLRIVACPEGRAADGGSAAPGAVRSAAGDLRKTCYRFAADVEAAIVEAGTRSDRYARQVIAANELLAEDRRICNPATPAPNNSRGDPPR